MAGRHSAVFLDRDGVINLKAPEGDYIKNRDELKLLPGVANAIARLNACGLPVIVVTNQRGVARGLMTMDDLQAVNEQLTAELAEQGARLDAIFFCVHDHADNCACRKPRPGMLVAAARRHDIDLHRSWMVGDRDSDVQAGLAAGCRTLLVGASPSPSAHHRTASLAEAVELILDDRR